VRKLICLMERVVPDGEKLKEICGRRLLSRGLLAAMAGISQGSVQRIERGDPVGHAVMARHLEALGIGRDDYRKHRSPGSRAKTLSRPDPPSPAPAPLKPAKDKAIRAVKA
jgi:transcriptional regulator with XRE-family HTH domain